MGGIIYMLIRVPKCEAVSTRVGGRSEVVVAGEPGERVDREGFGWSVAVVPCSFVESAA